MAKRKRDYRAEYIRRQRRSEDKYGISYSRQRRVLESAKLSGVEAEPIRQALIEAKNRGDKDPARNVLKALDVNNKLRHLNTDRLRNTQRIEAATAEIEDLIGDNALQFMRYKE